MAEGTFFLLADSYRVVLLIDGTYKTTIFDIVQIGSTKDLHIKVSDLKKGSSYDIRIMARNHVGYGKPYQPDDPIVAGKRISEHK